MTSPALSRLLISHITLRGPDLAQLYALVAARPGISYDDLVATLTPAEMGRDAFDLGEAALREALNFLLVVEVLEQEGPARRRACFRATPRLPDAPFALLLLHHIQSHQEERQRAPALIHRQLIAADTLAISTHALRDQMERGPLRSLFAWTGEKITFWCHLAHHLGLARRIERSTELLIVPKPALVLAALRWAMRDDPDTAHSVSALLDALDGALFACFTARGRVHQGLAQTLVALERAGHVQITHSADAARSLLLGERRVSDVRLLPGGGRL